MRESTQEVGAARLLGPSGLPDAQLDLFATEESDEERLRAEYANSMRIGQPWGPYTLARVEYRAPESDSYDQRPKWFTFACTETRQQGCTSGKYGALWYEYRRSEPAVSA